MPKNVMADVNIQGNGRQLNKDIDGNGGVAKVWIPDYIRNEPI